MLSSTCPRFTSSKWIDQQIPEISYQSPPLRLIILLLGFEKKPELTPHILMQSNEKSCREPAHMLVSPLCSHTLALQCDIRPRDPGPESCPPAHAPSNDAIIPCSFREVPKIKSDSSWSLRITYYKNSITKWQTHFPIRKLKKESQTKVNFKTENAGLYANRKCLYSQKIF